MHRHANPIPVQLAPQADPINSEQAVRIRLHTHPQPTTGSLHVTVRILADLAARLKVAEGCRASVDVPCVLLADLLERVDHVEVSPHDDTDLDVETARDERNDVRGWAV